MDSNIVKLNHISNEHREISFKGDYKIIEIDDTPNFVKYVVLFENGNIIYAEAKNGVFSYKSNFEF